MYITKELSHRAMLGPFLTPPSTNSTVVPSQSTLYEAEERQCQQKSDHVSILAWSEH